MPLPTSTLVERDRRIQGDINARLPGSDAGINKTVEHTVARATAGATHGHQGHADWVARQVVPGPDSDESTLERALIVVGLERKVAEYATGTLRIFGDENTVVLADTEFQKADGTVIDTDGANTIIDQGGSYYVDAAVTAVEPGTDGNCAASTTLTLVSPVGGVDSEATVQTALDGGTDLETVAEMWTRLQQRYANPPGAGTAADYERWALEVGGVTRAWAEGQALGAGTVRVVFVRDNDADLIPSPAEETEVETYIATKSPVTANVTVTGPTKATLTYDIDDITDLTAQANIDAALADYILRKAEPGVTLPLEEIIGAIDLAVGSEGFTLVDPAADVTHTALQIPVHGTITWPP